MTWLGNLVDLVLVGLFLVSVPYFAYILVVSLAAMFRKPPAAAGRPGSGESSPHARFLVVIPAHDEELVITPTVSSARALNYPAELFEVVVIADNCTDGTAMLAREAGARVVERSDPTRKSKGHAIEYLVETLQQSGEFEALDAIVIVDADSAMHPEMLRAFDRGLDAGHEWIQAYDCVGNVDQSWRTQLMAYSFSLINGVILQGQGALGLSACLCGNGMCLSTRGLRRVPWRTYGLTEDREYSWRVRIDGGRIAFEGSTAVYATMPTRGGDASATQRQRWERGRSQLKRKLLAPLLKSPRLGPMEKALAAIELTMPTMVALMGVFLLLSCVMALRLPGMLARREYLLATLMGVPYAIALLGMGLLAISPFLLGFLPWRISRSLLYLPYYAGWKVLIALKTRPRSWIRTARELASTNPGSPDAA